MLPERIVKEYIRDGIKPTITLIKEPRLLLRTTMKHISVRMLNPFTEIFSSQPLLYNMKSSTEDITGGKGDYIGVPEVKGYEEIL